MRERHSAYHPGMCATRQADYGGYPIMGGPSTIQAAMALSQEIMQFPHTFQGTDLHQEEALLYLTYL